MSKLEESFKELGIENILIVDDTPENLEAARALVQRFPSLGFTFSNSANEAISLITAKPTSIDLVFCDMAMEEPKSGLDVVKAAGDRSIPIVIVSGGYQHANQPIVRAHPLKKAFGEKHLPQTWVDLLKSALFEIQNPDEGTLKAMLVTRAAFGKNHVSKGEFSFGEHERLVYRGYFSDMA